MPKKKSEEIKTKGGFEVEGEEPEFKGSAPAELKITDINGEPSSFIEGVSKFKLKRKKSLARRIYSGVVPLCIDAAGLSGDPTIKEQVCRNLTMAKTSLEELIAREPKENEA